MAEKNSVLGLILSSSLYLRSAMAQFPLIMANIGIPLEFFEISHFNDLLLKFFGGVLGSLLTSLLCILDEFLGESGGCWL